MWIYSYKKKTGKQFLDFIKRVDQKYDPSVKQIFLVLDNVSIHRSNKVKQTIVKYHSRIHFVFLPVCSPELNLVEVEEGYGNTDRQLAIPHSEMIVTLVKRYLLGP
jgi:hypothetical protein